MIRQAGVQASLEVLVDLQESSGYADELAQPLRTQLLRKGDVAKLIGNRPVITGTLARVWKTVDRSFTVRVTNEKDILSLLRQITDFTNAQMQKYIEQGMPAVTGLSSNAMIRLGIFSDHLTSRHLLLNGHQKQPIRDLNLGLRTVGEILRETARMKQQCGSGTIYRT
ncbi:hypothetical protein BAUCODRAFT_151469 [Baudoinia panamericana UAMH 10762]|uniref:Uncharacterized protein n=1 Tax=Baudoinia panamericana (strain UAMH 10762) TaxID=717646 RepID=M2N344_BAUPA|nr:uncharacterized protein BAUCODRAFT_151469 [Baudoinia panamericana UAMH 10762]EMC93105.1 hypothetical protein BAUCODRAFT_151469 [Baudoinia panamericana UAMH 10762]